MITYDTAQVCLNGHLITDSANSHPELRKNKCNKCGADTITGCQNCKSPIKGDSRVPGVFMMTSSYHRPMFCENCAFPYPWIEGITKSCSALIDLSEILSQQEKEELVININSVMKTDSSVGIARVKARRTLDRIEEDLKQEIDKILSQFESK